ncbi:MAG: Sulfoxide reductase heme-binding subunit YedZ [Anaerolineae bacterium]|nr:Sulfoxide reductase heme-binding subunit YedZ [Anaerolineae bacterium]
MTNKQPVGTSKKNWLRENWLRVLTHVGAWLPGMWLAWNWFHNNLGADPVTTLNNVTGRAAMVLLLLCLAATPLYIVTGWRQGLAVRRALGLYAFAYAALHFANFIVLDYGLDLQFILDDGIQTKPYILVGLTALLALSALAITSTKGWQKRLRRQWTRLHALIYPAGVLVMLHFFWQAKAAEKIEPLLYAALLGLLLLVRVTPLRKAIVGRRQRGKTPKRSTIAAPEPAALTTPPQPTE